MRSISVRSEKREVRLLESRSLRERRRRPWRASQRLQTREFGRYWEDGRREKMRRSSESDRREVGSMALKSSTAFFSRVSMECAMGRYLQGGCLCGWRCTSSHDTRPWPRWLLCIEDGVTLARCLGDALLGKHKGGEDEYDMIKKGLDTYAKERRWRGFELIATAYVLGFMQQSDGVVMTFLMDNHIVFSENESVEVYKIIGG
ncbi:hypothetical protein MRB53_002501 [Persea americana]|uniref:Uncharacterized protein n=1 Tax=Persea americana TaxID=3435 RepID=A0ACC2MV23_PERAE|nr:hypothetical protein MRB53_002501 [Persea americana]